MKKIILTGCISSLVTYILVKPEEPKKILSNKEIKQEADSLLDTPLMVKPFHSYLHTEEQQNNYEIFFKERRPCPYIDEIAPIPDANWEIEMLEGIKFFEGYKKNKYFCSGGKATIGYGCTIPKVVSLGRIDEQHAEKILKEELKKVRELVLREVKVDLTDYQLCALTSFTFNCGLSNLKKLINSPERLNSGNYSSIEKILPKYRLAGGKVREGLVKRRKWEVSLWNGHRDIEY